MDYQTEYITEQGIEYEVRVHEDGSKSWRVNGTPHRVQGPALEYVGDYRIWCSNGKCHREDGPAMEWSNGKREWYWHGIFLTEEVEDQGIDQLSPEEIRFWLPILAARREK